jgi:hypothetical protein
MEGVLEIRDFESSKIQLLATKTQKHQVSLNLLSEYEALVKLSVLVF